MTLADEFRTWGDGRPEADPQRKLALEVASALEDSDSAKLWSQLSLREEFASRRSESDGQSGLLEFLSSVAYILPVLGAWWHLKRAFSAYAASVSDAGQNIQVNFLALWTGAYDGERWAHKSWSAASAAWTVIGLGAAIIFLQGWVGRRNSRLEKVQAELHDLVLRASLEFAKNRAVTPEELSAGINEAAVKLGEGLSNLRQAFDDTTELVREVQGVTGTIADSASALKSASDSLVDVMKPLTNFGQSAESAADLLRSTADAVDFARMTFETSMAGAGQVLSEELKSHAQTMENVRDAVTGVSNSVIRATTGLQQVVEGSGTAATKVNSLVGNLSGVSDNIALAASSLSSVVKTLVEANRTMGEIAESANSQEVTSYIEAVRNHAEAMVNGAMAVESAVRVLGEELGNWGEGRN